MFKYLTKYNFVFKNITQNTIILYILKISILINKISYSYYNVEGTKYR